MGRWRHRLEERPQEERDHGRRGGSRRDEARLDRPGVPPFLDARARDLRDFPHRAEIERRTGRRVPGRAVFDPSLEEHGHRAVTDGSTSYFASPSPGLEVAAHEAAHLLQHDGETRDQGLGVEGHAQRVAADVAAGRSAARRLGSAGRPVAPAARPYTEMTPAEQTARGEWKVGSKARVGDEGRTVTTENSRECWADPALIATSESTLKSRGSGVSISEGPGSITGDAPDGSGPRTLKEVAVKVSVSDPSTTNFYADCGRSSREVMGPTGTDTAPRGVYTSDTGVETETPTSYDPGDYRTDIFGKTGRIYTVERGDTLSKIAGKFLGDASRYMEIYDYGPNKRVIGPDPNLVRSGQTLLLPPGTAAQGRTHYLSLSPKEREAFDRLHGLNEYAAPEVGDAFTTRRDDALSGTGFNFHWAGVIMAAGPDRVTFENFAKPGTTYDTKDEKWYFETYGPASKPGQTFHEQNVGTVGGAGMGSTTFRART